MKGENNLKKPEEETAKIIMNKTALAYVIVFLIIFFCFGFMLGYIHGHQRGVKICEQKYAEYFEDKYYETYVIYTDENGTNHSIKIDNMLEQGLT